MQMHYLCVKVRKISIKIIYQDAIKVKLLKYYLY